MFKPLSEYTSPVFVTDSGDFVVTVRRTTNYAILSLRPYDGNNAFAGEPYLVHEAVFSPYLDDGSKTFEEAILVGLSDLEAKVRKLRGEA